MRIGIFPFALLAAVALASLLVVAASSLGRQARRGQRLSRGGLALLAVCSVALWAAWWFFFALMAALGHSPHPCSESWPRGVAGFILFVVVPGVVVAWQGRLFRHRGSPPSA